MALQAEDKEIVVPGQVIATGMDYLPSNGTYRHGEEIRANRVGLLKIEGKVIKSIPLAGVYIPQKNDVVIGRVIDILMTGWRVNLNSPYTSVLGLKDATFDFVSKGADLTKYFDLDDYLVTRIIQVTTQNLVDVTCKGPGLKKLIGGRIIEVSPHKVPRIIGSKGSMIGLVKKATQCKIIVGQNGVVWINGEPDKEALAYKIIKEIEEQAHLSGLTDKIKARLSELTGVDIDTLPDVEEEQEAFQDRPPRRPMRDGGRRPPRGDDRRGDDRRGGQRHMSRPPRFNNNNQGEGEEK